MAKIIHDSNSNLNRDTIREERQVPKENKFYASQRLKRGHSLFKFCDGVLSKCDDSDFYDEAVTIVSGLSVYTKPIDENTGKTIVIGNYKKVNKGNVVKKHVTTYRRSIRIEPNTIYRSALNYQNAEKIFKALGFTIRLIK